MTASSRVIESTAPLLAVYATCGVAAPSFATNDAVLMIDPPPARRSAGMPNLQPRNTPRALMRIVSSHVSSLVEIASSRSEEHTSELQSRLHLVCRLLLEKKKNKRYEVSW